MSRPSRSGSSGIRRPDYNVIAEVLEANKISPKIFRDVGRGKARWSGVIDVTYGCCVGAVIFVFFICRVGGMGLPRAGCIDSSDAATLWRARSPLRDVPPSIRAITSFARAGGRERLA